MSSSVTCSSWVVSLKEGGMPQFPLLCLHLSCCFEIQMFCQDVFVDAYNNSLGMAEQQGKRILNPWMTLWSRDTILAWTAFRGSHLYV